MMRINLLHNNPKNGENTAAGTTWYQSTGAHIKRHKWKYGLGAAVLAAGMGYFMWQARNAPVETRETIAVTSTATAGQGYGRRPAQMRATTETAIENASEPALTPTTGTAYDTTAMQTSTMAIAPNVGVPTGAGSIRETAAYKSTTDFRTLFGFEKKYIDPATHPDMCRFGPYISVMQRADIEDSLIRQQLTTPITTETTATTPPVGAASTTAAANTSTTASASTNTAVAPAPATQAVGHTYTIGDTVFTFKTPSQYLSPGTIVFHDGDKAFRTPVATMQQGEKGTPMYTSLDQIMDAQRANVTKRGVFATPFDAELKSNLAGVYTTSIGNGQSVEFTSPEGKVRLSKRFNTEQVYKIVGDNIVTADEMKLLGAKDLLVVYEIDRGDQSVLTGGRFTYMDQAVAGTLPMITSSKAPVYETIESQRSMAGARQTAQQRATRASYGSAAQSAGVESDAVTNTGASSAAATGAPARQMTPQTIEQRVKPSAPTIVGNVVGDVIVNGSDVQRFNIISPRDAYGWMMGTVAAPKPIITQESFDAVAKEMYPRAPSVPAGVYKGN